MRVLICIALFAFFSACATLPENESDAQSAEAVRSAYCDSYLIYEMCAVDVDGNGTTDALYFDDTNEIFMYDSALATEDYSAYQMHPCVQVMDGEMKEASNLLLTVADNTPFMERLAIKKGLMFNYMRYNARVQECYSQIASSADDAASDTPFDDEGDFF